VQFNTFGAGLRKFANEANDFVQDLLNVPIIPSEGVGEKVVDLPKQRDMKVVRGEQQVAKQPAKQATAAAPMNFFDEACMKMSKKGSYTIDLFLRKLYCVEKLFSGCLVGVSLQILQS